ncbi:hypothetical protein OG883_45395 [Streptomyces sp. NBC_01142]|uniref:hypothetical protein n=1 Tax=Streptomyces sp. NBC_01142 TaxID=2975865 RepID=UPI00225A4CB8|nr:hypothetical protein [Streptomyces sp. NBC_01142]MCX4826875.1 hypothetical protein [Streptomyces sp. NBC_01142]
MTTSPALLPVHACDHVLHISAVETPLITEFVAALSHLERAAALSGTSGALMLPNGKSVTTREMSEWVAMNTNRLHALLGKITDTFPEQKATVPSSLT